MTQMPFTRKSMPTAFLIKELKKKHENTKTPHDPDNYKKKTYVKAQKYPRIQTFFFLVF